MKPTPPPKRLMMADDTLKADTAYRLASEGTHLLWQGDFHQAKQLMQAMARRLDATARLAKKTVPPPEGVHPMAHAFHRHRQAQAHRARLLGSLLVPMLPDYTVPLRRAPDVRSACLEAWGAPNREETFHVPLRELLGVIGAHEWRKKGVAIAALGSAPHHRIHPYHGVFSPVRGEYLALVAQAPLPSLALAFDIGVGTGVLSAVLAQRGVQRIVATDLDPQAIACAQDNLQRLGFLSQVTLQQCDLFPEGQAPLVICNPPWVPARPSAAIERAVYDENSTMLRGFLAGLRTRLTPDGEGWLILSDLAEHLGLRTREELLGWITSGGLRVIARLDTRPHHPKTAHTTDPLHRARSAEITSLWRLGVA